MKSTPSQPPPASRGRGRTPHLHAEGVVQLPPLQAGEDWGGVSSSYKSFTPSQPPPASRGRGRTPSFARRGSGTAPSPASRGGLGRGKLFVQKLHPLPASPCKQGEEQKCHSLSHRIAHCAQTLTRNRELMKRLVTFAAAMAISCCGLAQAATGPARAKLDAFATGLHSLTGTFSRPSRTPTAIWASPAPARWHLRRRASSAGRR